ncbi:glycosyltransferase [Streptococcaceae bacterium ESL0687]|nr:glycosyltransferase [Streptococcaceae bacterium ESL0687]
MSKILVLSPFGGFGNGADISMNHQMTYLRSLGYEIVNVYNQGSDSYREFLEKEGIKGINLNYTWWDETELADELKANNVLIYQELVSLIRSEEVDLLITNTSNMPWGAIAASITNIPHIWLLHEFAEGDFDWVKDKYPFIDAFSNKILCSSDSLARAVQKEVKQKVDFFNPYTNAPLIAGHNEEIRLVSVNYLSHGKNQMELLYALKQLVSKGYGMPVLFSGRIEDGRYYQEILSYIKDNGLEDYVTFTYAENGNWQPISKNDIFVSPSKSETFGLTYVEAMKVGIPVITALNGGAETLEEAGYLSQENIYTTGDIEELVSKVIYMVENHGDIKKKAESIQVKVLEEQSLEKITEPLAEAIKSLKGLNNPATEIMAPWGENLVYNLGGLKNLLEGRLSYIRDLESEVINLHGKYNIIETKLQEDTIVLKSQDKKIDDLKVQLEDSNKQIALKDQEYSYLDERYQYLINSWWYRGMKLAYRPIKKSRSALPKMKNFVKRGIKKALKANPKLYGYVKQKNMARALRKEQKRQAIANKPSKELLALQKSRKEQRESYSYDTNNAKRSLIFVVYEGQERLQSYKLYFLDHLAKFVEDIYIVVNGHLDPEDLGILSNYGQIMERENAGYDATAFKYAVDHLGKEVLSNYDQLLLVNDTSLGPVNDFEDMFKYFSDKKVDMWGITEGETQIDPQGLNKYGYIPHHIQTYFVVIEKPLLESEEFYQYFTDMPKITNRDEAIMHHETVFTKNFTDLGYSYDVYVKENRDSAVYHHPYLLVSKFNNPIIKFTALEYDNDLIYQLNKLHTKTEVPELLKWVEEETDYPLDILEEAIQVVKNKEESILIIDGVHDLIPQLTRYRVENKKEQLVNLGFNVRIRSSEVVTTADLYKTNFVIIYRAWYNENLQEIVDWCRKLKIPVFFDVDDLVIDTSYTDQLSYTQGLSVSEKANYDSGVMSYRRMMLSTDGVIASTNDLARELKNYKKQVLLNRNLANEELVKISKKALIQKEFEKISDKVKIGYFSGSITHNENFELIKASLEKIMEERPLTELHLVGHLDLPEDMSHLKDQIITHDYVDWKELPQLIAQVDINLAPLVDSIFNRAKSEIKWIEASLVKVPTIASNIGAFADSIHNRVDGILVENTEEAWYEALEQLVNSPKMRTDLAEEAYKRVREDFTTTNQEDDLSTYIRGQINHD